MAARPEGLAFESLSLAVKDYVARLVVKEDGANGALVEWSGSFTPTGMTEAEAEALFKGMYEGGLEALKANF